MVIKGRSRGNGKQLADYLLNSQGNDRASVLDIRGTAQPDNLRRSLLEMSLSSELSKRGDKGLYHAQINPAIGEDRPMTPEDWKRAADVLEGHLGLEGQKRAIVLHEKQGRIHGHVVWERFDHEAGRFRTDSQSYKKHDRARAEIEKELNHEPTRQQAPPQPGHKDRLTALWSEQPEGAAFVQNAQEAGYLVCQGNDRRPFRVIAPDGQSLDLTRQLDGVKVKEVRDRLNPIRATLPTEADALIKSRESLTQQPEPELPAAPQSEKALDFSDVQDVMMGMKLRYRQTVKEAEKPAQTVSYSFKIEQTLTPASVQQVEPPALRQQPEQKTQSDKLPETSEPEMTDKAQQLLDYYRARRDRQHQQQQEARQQASEQTKQASGDEADDDAKRLLDQLRQKQRTRGWDRDGPEL